MEVCWSGNIDVSIAKELLLHFFNVMGLGEIDQLTIYVAINLER